MNGFVHSFESLGTLDGPGVRCVVFLQGCPLRCIYCHNPDTWDRTKGISFSAEEVVRRVSRYRPYFGETGGITISGGEPLLQAEFVTDIFRLCRESGIHTVLDTSGHGADLSSLIPLLKETDLVLLDIKMTTEQDYAEKIGGSLQKTMDFSFPAGTAENAGLDSSGCCSGNHRLSGKSDSAGQPAQRKKMCAKG